uniref:Protein goliath n=1 Tax=Lygus hesperus TaxID=30085 RepID=A0A146KNG8_LYGHE
MSLRPFLLAFAALALNPCVCSPEPIDPEQDCHATAFIGTVYRDQGGTEYAMRSEIGAYADGYETFASGALFKPPDDVGCSAPQEERDEPWVALVRRGGCSIETKIENALRGKATGIIIYSSRDSLNLNKAKVTRKYQGTISVVFTYKWKGDELRTLLSADIKVLVELSLANPCVRINTNNDRNMKLFSISFLCFLVLSISVAWMVFYYVQRYRDLQARERKARGYSEADEKALKAIPTKTIKANDQLLKDEMECCAICIDPYRQLEVVRTLSCNHEFHKDCIDPWLLENRTCPMCKKDILRHYGSVFLGSQESIIQVVAEEAARLAGPSTPAPHGIQVVIVVDGMDDVSETSRASSPAPSDANELQILTERVQPINTDVAYIASSSTSLMTVDSAHEAMSFVGSCEEVTVDSELTEVITDHSDVEVDEPENEKSVSVIDESRTVESENKS